MTSFDFRPRTRILFGAGEFARLGEVAREHNATRCLLLADQAMANTGAAREAIRSLKARRVEVFAFHDFETEPTVAMVEAAREYAAPQAVDLLMVADWPGNVRQLCNEVQRIVARGENGTLITPEQLSPELRQMGVPTVPPSSVSVMGITATGRSEVVPIENVSLAEALEEVERRMIGDAMRRHKGNISRVARELGLTRRGLYLKLDRYNMKEREGTND